MQGVCLCVCVCVCVCVCAGVFQRRVPLGRLLQVCYEAVSAADGTLVRYRTAAEAAPWQDAAICAVRHAHTHTHYHSLSHTH